MRVYTLYRCVTEWMGNECGRDSEALEATGNDIRPDKEIFELQVVCWMEETLL